VLPESEYLALKAEVFNRAGWLCEGCGRKRYLTPHHRKLLSQGGMDAAENLLALCKRCHDWAHEHVAESVRNGRIVPSWADPAERPVLLHDGRKVLLTPTGGYALAA
jgi:5-methylcytosine-specific restriction endonuclease McrA